MVIAMVSRSTAVTDLIVTRAVSAIAELFVNCSLTVRYYGIIIVNLNWSTIALSFV